MKRALLVAVVLLAGCGEDEPGPVSVAVPAAAVRACRELPAGQAVRVLCPRGAGRAIVKLLHVDLDPDPCTYVVNLEALKPDPDDRLPSHVLYGGACGEVPFTVRADGRWSVDPAASIRLAGSPPYQPGGTQPVPSLPHVVARVRVRGHPGLLLRAEPFPRGGVNGSHYALVWHEAGATYQVSAHWRTGDRGQDPSGAQRAALQRFASSLVGA